jgi:hypothetical protein
MKEKKFESREGKMSKKGLWKRTKVLLKEEGRKEQKVSKQHWNELLQKTKTMLQQTWTSCMIHRIPYFLQTLFSCFGFLCFVELWMSQSLK